jgi:hypothetical protein
MEKTTENEALTMPFSPRKKHQDVQLGFCVDCGTPIPKEAISVKDGRALTYSHTDVSGKPVFCQNPKGRSEPCQPSTCK